MNILANPCPTPVLPYRLNSDVEQTTIARLKSVFPERGAIPALVNNFIDALITYATINHIDYTNRESFIEHVTDCILTLKNGKCPEAGACSCNKHNSTTLGGATAITALHPGLSASSPNRETTDRNERDGTPGVCAEVPSVENIQRPSDGTQTTTRKSKVRRGRKPIEKVLA